MWWGCVRHMHPSTIWHAGRKGEHRWWGGLGCQAARCWLRALAARHTRALAARHTRALARSLRPPPSCPPSSYPPRRGLLDAMLAVAGGLGLGIGTDCLESCVGMGLGSYVWVGKAAGPCWQPDGGGSVPPLPCPHRPPPGPCPPTGVPAQKFRPICSAIDKLDKEPWEAVGRGKGVGRLAGCMEALAQRCRPPPPPQPLTPFYPAPPCPPCLPRQVRCEMVEDKGLPGEVADAIGRFVVLR
jgi:hypothetical protein